MASSFDHYKPATLEKICKEGTDGFLKPLWLPFADASTAPNSEMASVGAAAYVRMLRGAGTVYMSEQYATFNSAKKDACQVAMFQGVRELVGQWGHLAEPFRRWEYSECKQALSVEVFLASLRDGAKTMGAAVPHPDILTDPFKTIMGIHEAYDGTLEFFPMIDDATGRM